MRVPGVWLLSLQLSLGTLYSMEHGPIKHFDALHGAYWYSRLTSKDNHTVESAKCRHTRTRNTARSSS